MLADRSEAPSRMEYPLFEVPHLGGGMLTAIVAIVHVVIAHFAVGAGIYLAITHTLAMRRNDALLLRYLEDHSRFLVLFSFVAGAITGVGIWVTIGLVSPAATSLLIHNFVWGWAAEWCFFVIEIAAGYTYYYGFRRLTLKQQAAAAWVYAIAAFMSLVIINGILAFMLTPGEWGEALIRGETLSPDMSFWLAFFNPSYYPSLILRTVSCLALAAIFVAVVVNLYKRYTLEEAKRIINWGAYFMMPLALMVPVGIWYFYTLPKDSRLFVSGGAIAMTLFMAFGLVVSLVIGFYAYFGMLRHKRYIDLETSLLLLAFAFVATGSMEFVREGVRKPYIVYGAMYSNGIPAAGEMPRQIEEKGILVHTPFVLPPGTTVEDVQKWPLHEKGALVYEAECRMCHEIDGFNPLRQLVDGKSRELLLAQMRELEEWAFMPPFLGTEAEMKALVEFQVWLHRGEEYEAPPAAYLKRSVDEILETFEAEHGPLLAKEVRR